MKASFWTFNPLCWQIHVPSDQARLCPCSIRQISDNYSIYLDCPYTAFLCKSGSVTSVLYLLARSRSVLLLRFFPWLRLFSPSLPRKVPLDS